MCAGVPHYTRLVIGISCFLVLGGNHDEGFAQPPDSTRLQNDSQSDQIVTIMMESYQYTPSEILLETGKAVTLILKNESFLVPHNFLLDDPKGVRLIDADISSGEEHRVQFTPTLPGTYPFYCDKQLLFFPSHREQGMEGRFLVR